MYGYFGWCPVFLRKHLSPVEVVQLLSGVATGNWVDASKKMTFAWLGLSHNMCVVNSYPPRHTEVAVIVDNSALTKKSVSGITAAGG